MAEKKLKKTPAKRSPRVNKTQQHKKKLLEALEKSLGVVTVACKTAELDRTTFYNYYNSDPEFKEAVDSIEDIALDFAESQLHQQIRDGEVTSTIFYLKTKGKRRGYIEKTQQELSNPDGSAVMQPVADAFEKAVLKAYGNGSSDSSK